MKSYIALALISLLGLAGYAEAQAAQVKKAVFLGNSITKHGPLAKIGWAGDWGMAATALEKDYVHLVVAHLSKAQGGVAPDFRVVNIAEFERNYESYDLAKNLKDVIDFQPDTVILAIGENVPELKTPENRESFKQRTIQLLTLLKGSGAQLYVRSSFWAGGVKDALLKEAATATGAHFVDISTLGKDESLYARSERKIAHEGVARHPGDKGMQAIADAIANVIETSGK